MRGENSAQFAVACHSAGNANRLYSGLFGRGQNVPRKRVNYGLLEAATHGRLVLRQPRIALFRAKVFHGGFEAGEAEVQALQPRNGEGDVGVFQSLPGRLFYRPSGRVGESEQLAYFVENLSRGIVNGLAQACVLSEFVNAVYCGMTSGDNETQKRIGNVIVIDKEGAYVSFKVVNTRYGHPELRMKPECKPDTHQQSACKAGAVGHRNAVNSAAFHRRIFEKRTRQNFYFAQVRPRCQLRNNATECGVNSLGVHPAGDNFSIGQ